MERLIAARYLRVAAVAAIFSFGFFCGSLSRQDAQAQLGNVGGDLLKRAEQGGGTMGGVAQLGSTISDMEKNVNGLQKNLDTLKKVRALLGR
ncbi:hypothetical protein [Geomesophilobacter sediminis]|uniref:Uncharacterized protein n=1 Tax=Geomesophilobacter sediminis TaxID=2798584 RepID=A0A8J7M0J3_9BACT|nr:hypothetical protein [Geomesophilobacter sediminis]MBJ6725487.1 hypothetical protein [Geomesophilobacter sediminis]